MYKYCTYCGYQNHESTDFCSSCGRKFQENVQTYNKNQIETYPGQSQTYIPKKSSKKMIIILPIIATLVAIMLIIVFLNPFSQSGTQEVKIYTGSGPTINLQSLTSGNAIAIPEDGRTAIYGFYLGSQKLGEISHTSEGIVFYQDIECYKIVGSGAMSYEYSSYSIDFIYNYCAYISKHDNTLIYSELSYEYLQPTTYEMEMSISVDKEKGELTTTVNGIKTISKLPDYYWDINFQNNLYVGYKEEINYNIYSSGYSYNATMKIFIPVKEDVVVPAGKFLDCYKIIYEMESEFGIITSTSVWVNDNWITPKMQIGSASSEMNDIDLSISVQLISYN